MTTTTNPAVSNSLADLRERLKAEHFAVGKALKTSLAHAMTADDILIEAKTQLGQHGAWLPWLESCGLSERTSQRYTRLARNRTSIEANPTGVSDLGIRGALALLAVPPKVGHRRDYRRPDRPCRSCRRKRFRPLGRPGRGETWRRSFQTAEGAAR